MEMHGTVAVWDGDNLTLYESTQAVVGTRTVMSEVLGVPRENLRVISRFIGSGFGGKLSAWPQAALAGAAARQLKRPVKVSVDRRMMFSNVGHRPRTEQRIRLGATQDGKLTAIRHDFLSETSQLDDFMERCGEQTPFLYSCPNLVVTAAMVRRNVGAPAPMRGPGAVPGLFALESAMDELAVKLKMDPLELRLKNDAERDEGRNLPFSSRHLKECYTTGAEKIGWKQRTPEVGSMRRDGKVIGWGLGGSIVGRGAHSLHSLGGTLPQRTRVRSLRHAGYRHRNVHRFRAGNSRKNGSAARPHRRFPRRQLSARWPDIRWVDGDQRVAAGGHQRGF